MTPHSPLVTAEALQGHVPDVRFVDCSHDLGKPQLGQQLFAEAHIPTAVHSHLDLDLSGTKNGTNGRHPLPTTEKLVSWLGAQGISSLDTIVAYDRSGGMYAARFWWLLKWLGHRQVRVLDGGWQAWVAAGHPVTQEMSRFDAVSYGSPSANHDMCVDAAFVEANLVNRKSLLVDARGAERFAGTVEPMDPRAGHIPGAVNRPYTENLGSDGCFKSSDVLAAEWKRILGKTNSSAMVAQCGSGVTACHNLLALEVANLPMGRLYPGSWSEWCSDPQRPVQTGAA